MTIYLYECPLDHYIESNFRGDKLPCPIHDAHAQRKWFVNAKRGLEGHFNFALGQYVTSDRDFNEKLKIAGEEAGANFTRVDPGDQPRPTTDDQMFDTQMRTLTDRGFVGADKKVTIDDRGNFVRKS